MRNYIILNGTNSNTITGLLIQELAPISKPLMRTEIEEIDGRDGDIITPLGFSAYDKEITIGLYGSYDINEIIAFFNSEGTVIFSNEPDKYYNYTIYQQIDFERLVRFRTATVTLHCQPFKFATTGETVSFGDGSTVSGEGTNLVLEGSQLAPFNHFDLKGNTVQDGTPTPSSPVPVKVVTGYNNISIRNVNLLKDTPEVYSFERRINFQALPAGTYYVSCGKVTKGGANDPQIGDANSHAAITSNMMNQQFTLSTNNNITMYSNGWSWGASEGVTSTVEKLIITAAPIASIADYEPYIEQNYEVNLGKNLFDKSAATLGYRMGATGEPYADANYNLSDYIAVQPSTSYTYSRYKAVAGAESSGIAYYASDKTFISRYIWGASISTYTATTPSNAYYVRIFDNKTVLDQMQFEKGSSSTTYAAYFAPLMLAKIGSLQDYIYKSGDKWYLHEDIGKVDLSSLTWSATTGTIRGATAPNAKYVSSNQQIGVALTDGYRLRQGSGLGNAGTGWFAVDTAKFNFNTGSSTNPVGMLYYELATPTNTEITSSALIEQLEAIANQAHAYKTRTYIDSNAATGNVPHIIAAEVVTASADGTVTNAGNIYSKPTLTIYGSGNIGVYLGGVQMLQVALGSLGHITIDTNLMEAYKDSLENLQNRAVTGDYTNFKLPVGSSKISFSGIVTSCIVENFSRWL